MDTHMDDETFPEVPKYLLERLKKHFPNQIPVNKAITMEDIRFLQGTQAVLALLESHFTEQNKTVLKDPS